MQSDSMEGRTEGTGTLAYFALAFGITWLAEVPIVVAFVTHTAPAGLALAGAALSAFGPTFAALAVAGRRGELRQVFGRWRTSPVWIVLALFVPMSLHLVATALEVALGGEPAQWLYPPVRPEHVAALVMFSIGEEFGWRGFAYPRLARRHGPVVGSLILGALWGAWHLLMSVSPETGSLDLFGFGLTMLELPLYSVVIAFFFERSNRSMAVAIAIHMGAHLDNVHRAPQDELRLWGLRLLVLAVAAAVAGRALAHARASATTDRVASPD